MSKVLAIDILPFRHSTRTRKLAIEFASAGHDVVAITLERAGRTGIQDLRSSFNDQGVTVGQVPVRPLRTGTSTVDMVANVVRSYGPGLLAVAHRTLRTRCDVLILGNTALIWVGVIHQRLYGSRVVVSSRERLGGVRSRGSLATLSSRMEPRLRRYFARDDVTIVAVCEGHALAMRKVGARHVLVVRNAPTRSFVEQGPWPPPPVGGPIVFSLVGSLYEGRGLEPLIEAASILKRRGVGYQIEITGRGRPEFLEAQQRRVTELDLSDEVKFMGECEPEEVSARYGRSHVALVLYEPLDPANDSLSNKMLEAIGAGRPVLAGDLPENRAFVTKYRVGWLCPVTPEGIADAMSEVIASRIKFETLFHRCRALAMDELNWERECEPVTCHVLGRAAGS